MFCLYVYHMQTWCHREKKRALDPLDPMFANCQVGAGKETQLLCKSNRCS